MEPLYSWGAFVCIGGAVFLYYMKDSNYAMKAKDSVASSTSSAKQSMTSGAKRKQNKDTSRKRETTPRSTSEARIEPSSYAEAASTSATTAPVSGNTKKRKAGKPSAPMPSAAPVPQIQEEPADENDDSQWAAQLAAARKGITLNKQSGRPSSNEVSRSQSRAESPSAQHGVRTAGGVDDMLEPRAAGPSSIRITGADDNKQKPKTAKKEEQVETKKQRQNRKKKEAQATQREADERERKVLAEKQRRMARESRGEAAKDGSSFKAPTSSVWTAGSQAGGAPGQDAPSTAPLLSANPVQMLDTYEQDGASTSSSNEANTNTATPATATSTLEDYPTEEAQMAAIQEQVGWNEVQTKKQKKKGTKVSTPNSPPSEAGSKGSNGYGNLSAGDLVDGTSEATTPVAKQPPIMKPEPKQKQAAPQQQSKQNKPVSNGNLFAALDAQPGHPDDSDWAA